jgi:DNA processing protein
MSTADSPLADAESPDLIDAMRLSLVSGVGPKIRQALLERFGSPAAVFAASLSELREVDGVGPKLAHQIREACDNIDVTAELAICREHGIDIVADTCDAYPRALREIHDPPAILFVQGKLLPHDALAVAIVGTRHATSYGKEQAERLASSLARAGLVIVSGLARGVDAAAHRGALEAGGRTLAVLGGGILELYPPEHKELAFDIARSGAVLSVLPPRTQPLSGCFPLRNRLISGLSLGSATPGYK